MLGFSGEGNFHVGVTFEPADTVEKARAEAVVDRFAMRALGMGGTCTGEHGSGQGKRKFVRLEHGAAADFMAAIKRAIDPDNIMNPGKMLALD